MDKNSTFYFFKKLTILNKLIIFHIRHTVSLNYLIYIILLKTKINQLRCSRMVEIYNDDCLNTFKKFNDHSIDCIICDLPYAITTISWDCLIPFNELWAEYNRIIKDNGNIVLFSSGFFTVNLINSNINNFKYKLIWKKNVPTGMSSAKYRPMKYYEEICIFNNGVGTYNPIMKDRVGINKICYNNYEHYCGDSNHTPLLNKKPKKYDPNFVQPSDILEFNVVPNRNGKLHPTQKPIELMEWLVNTYSNENDIVLDNCMGSGTTGIACQNLNRNFIGIEKNEKYFNIAKERLKNNK